jgi:hypothetical protein
MRRRNSRKWNIEGAEIRIPQGNRLSLHCNVARLLCLGQDLGGGIREGFHETGLDRLGGRVRLLGCQLAGASKRAHAL